MLHILIRRFAPRTAARWCMERGVFRRARIRVLHTQAKAIYSRLKAEPVLRPSTLVLVLVMQRQ
jgi:hypothetical protein